MYSTSCVVSLFDHTETDSSCTTLLTESDIRILHVHTKMDSVLESVHTTSLRFIHVTFLCNCHGLLTLENKADFRSKRASGATYWIHAFTLAQK